MKIMRFKFMILSAAALFLSGCESAPVRTAAASKPAESRAMTAAQLEKMLIGTWDVVQTSASTEKLDNETKYSFLDEGKRCRKKNLFHGFFEELEGTYTITQKGAKNYLLIKFDKGFQEKFEFTLESTNKLNMIYFSGAYQYRYSLERAEDDIMDVL